MSRLVDADALIEVIKESRPLNWTDSDSELQEDADYNHFIEMVKEQPTAYDVEKVVAEYRQAEEQGLLLKLPCKVGDTVYVLKFEGVWRIIPHQVKTLGYIVQLIENEAIDDFVFLTREEAEQALAEMQKG